VIPVERSRAPTSSAVPRRDAEETVEGFDYREDQQHRDSGLNLVVTAIILWNQSGQSKNSAH
jgi:hypothetical protein